MCVRATFAVGRFEIRLVCSSRGVAFKGGGVNFRAVIAESNVCVLLRVRSRLEGSLAGVRSGEECVQ